MTHTPRKQAKPMTSVGKDIFDTVLYTFGIYFCYILYGVMQEEIYRVGSGDDKFKYSLFLVFVQCAVNAILAGVVLIATGQPTNNGTPALEFFQPSFAYIGAMFSSNLSLVYVSYPTQALGKSCKLIPVMLMSVFVHGKRYKLREYINVLLITVGISVFQLMKASKKAGGGEDSLIGLALLFTSLILDGFVGPSQEKLIEKRQPSQTQLMFQMNMYACLLLVVALGLTNGLFPAFAFCQRFPEVWKYMIAFSVLSALGQTVIMMTLFRFNSLILTTITTTRKFFTILASVVIFGHTLTLYQWLGVGLVFLGLGLDIYHKYHDKKQRHKAHLDALAKDAGASSAKSPRKEATAAKAAPEQDLRKRK